MIGSFRAGVCVALVNRFDSKLILVCHRTGLPPDLGWQFPQGGIDLDKPLIQEAQRELQEEIGTDAIRILQVSNGVYCYRFPPENSGIGKAGKYAGQCHRWIRAVLLASDSQIAFGPQPAEFDAYKWSNAVQILGNIAPFKQDAYQGAMTELGLI